MENMNARGNHSPTSSTQMRPWLTGTPAAPTPHLAANGPVTRSRPLTRRHGEVVAQLLLNIYPLFLAIIYRNLLSILGLWVLDEVASS